MGPALKRLSFDDFQGTEELHVFSTSENISLRLCKMGLRQAYPRRALQDLIKHFRIVM